MTSPLTLRPVTVPPAGVKLWLDHLANSADWHSVLREGFKNALDAGAKNVFYGHIDGSSNPLDRKMGKKLYLLDDGTGFDPDKMDVLLGDLFSSDRIQGLNDNLGVGLKLASFAQNPAGTEYFTKRAGDPFFYHALTRTNECGNYGLMPWADGSYIEKLTRGDVPDPIRNKEHGTLVIYHGENAAHDTTVNPAAIGGRSWVARSLNRRFFDLPADVTVRSEEQYSSTRAKQQFIKVTGGRAFLERINPGPKSGTVKIRATDHQGGPASATVTWYLLPESITGGSHGREDEGCITALLRDDELYDARYNGDARAILARFGVTKSSQRVILHLELPKDFVPDFPRTKLARNAANVDYAAFGAAFIDKMPKEIADLEEQLARRHRQAGGANRFMPGLLSLAERLSSLKPQWRLARNGTERADCSNIGTTDRIKRDNHGAHGTSDENAASRTMANRSGSDPGTDRARATRQRPETRQPPTVIFGPAGDLDDETAVLQWEPASNIVRVNNDHMVVVGAVDYWASRAIDTPKAQAAARDGIPAVLKAKLAERALTVSFFQEGGVVSATDDLVAALTSVFAEEFGYISLLAAECGKGVFQTSK